MHPLIAELAGSLTGTFGFPSDDSLKGAKRQTATGEVDAVYARLKSALGLK